MTQPLCPTGIAGGFLTRVAADAAAGRLEAIGVAAEQVYRSLRDRLQPDAVEMEIAVGLSAEVGWFVAKSAASGSR